MKIENMKKVLIVLSGVLFLSLGSCEKDDTVKVTKNRETDLKVYNLEPTDDSEIDFKEYFSNLRSTIKKDFIQLEKNYTIYNNWVAAGEKIYEGNELALNNFRNNLDQSQIDFNLSSRSGSSSSGYQLNEVHKIINEAQKFQTFKEYNDFIDERFEYYLNDLTMSNDNKKFILTFLVSYSESLDFISKNNNFDGNNGGYSARSWWDNWWRCITSVVGGLVTGSTTLGLAGAAVGTVALPVIGTVSGGLIGAIGGAIGGALTGAASGC